MSGFHKRKDQRRKVAKAALDKKIKAEIKRIRQETKDNIKKNCKSFEPIKFPQFEDEDQNVEEEVIEDDSVMVSVVPLGVDELAQKHNWIGSNKGMKEVIENGSDGSDDEEANETEEIPGMGLKKQQKPKLDAPEEPKNFDSTKRFESKKDIDREMKKKTMKALKKNKTLQAKTRQERAKNLKKSRRTAHFKNKTRRSSSKPRRKQK